MFIDPRLLTLANNIVQNACTVQPGEQVLIDLVDVPDSMAVALIRAVHAVGGIPHLNTRSVPLMRELLLTATEAQLEARAEFELTRMKKMQAYIVIRGSNNGTEMADVPADKLALADKYMNPVLDYRVNHTKWCLLIWPTPAVAQMAGMSTEAFENFFLKVCTFDYKKFKPGMTALKNLMASTDKVHIVGPGTDLKFSIKGIGAEACGGNHNIPDGEVFSCPVKESVNGVIQFNAPTIYDSIPFDNIRLVFKDGKIVEATGSNTERLNAILDTDEGARYIGEFAIGFNPFIQEAMRDILFDEKIAGSLHFTPGAAYESAGNGNKSNIHWDMVNIQTPKHGGGEIWFDGVLIRKDGEFTLPELQSLNRSNLLANEE